MFRKKESEGRSLSDFQRNHQQDHTKVTSAFPAHCEAAPMSTDPSCESKSRTGSPRSVDVAVNLPIRRSRVAAGFAEQTSEAGTTGSMRQRPSGFISMPAPQPATNTSTASNTASSRLMIDDTSLSIVNISSPLISSALSLAGNNDPTSPLTRARSLPMSPPLGALLHGGSMLGAISEIDVTASGSGGRVAIRDSRVGSRLPPLPVAESSLNNVAFIDSPLLTAFTVSTAAGVASLDPSYGGVAGRFQLPFSSHGLTTTKSTRVGTIGMPTSLSTKRIQRSSNHTMGHPHESASSIVLVSLCDSCTDPHPVDKLMFLVVHPPTGSATTPNAARSLTDASSTTGQVPAAESVTSSPISETTSPTDVGSMSAGKISSATITSPQTPKPVKPSKTLRDPLIGSRLASPPDTTQVDADLGRATLRVLCGKCYSELPPTEYSLPWRILEKSLAAQKRLAGLGRLFQATEAVSSSVSNPVATLGDLGDTDLDDSITMPLSKLSGAGASGDSASMLTRMMRGTTGNTASASNRMGIPGRYPLGTMAEEKGLLDVHSDSASTLPVPSSMSKPPLVPVSTPFAGPSTWAQSSAVPESSLGPSQMSHPLPSTEELPSMITTTSSSRRKNASASAHASGSSNANSLNIAMSSNPDEVLASMSPAVALAAALVFMKGDLDALMAQRDQLVHQPKPDSHHGQRQHQGQNQGQGR